MDDGVVRIDFALSPSEPQASAIIDASQEITRRFENRNVIDRDRFPPHLSLHIAVVPAGRVDELVQLVADATAGLNRRPTLVAGELVEGSSGYVSLRVEITQDLGSLHRAVIEAAATVREGGHPRLSPNLGRYEPPDQERYQKYGNVYVLERFDAHFSIAKVSWQDQSDALAIAEKHLLHVPPGPAEGMLICDIGPRSEKWEVLARL